MLDVACGPGSATRVLAEAAVETASASAIDAHYTGSTDDTAAYARDAVHVAHVRMLVGARVRLG